MKAICTRCNQQRNCTKVLDGWLCTDCLNHPDVKAMLDLVHIAKERMREEHHRKRNEEWRQRLSGGNRDDVF